jgi:ribose transport system ATP-binding protein
MSHFGVATLTRSFGPTVALSDVDMDIERGEIHALLGGNGSGKSTLVKILSGVLPADHGEIVANGERVDVSHWSASRARAAHFHVVHQDGATFPDLTVAENLAIGRGFDRTAYGRIRWRAAARRTARVLDRFGIEATPNTMLSELRPADRMMVAIARALQDQENAHDGLLILDEPTAALSNADTDRLLAALKRYAAMGQAILYISHRLDEVLRSADRFTVLRDGHVVVQQVVAGLTEQRLVEMIVGRHLSGDARSNSDHERGTPLLTVAGLQGGPVRDASFTVNRGEVVGVAGSLGSGRSHLLRLIYGAALRSNGSIVLAGREVKFRSPHKAMAAGVALVPEDRAGQASFPDLSVRENLSAASIRYFWRAGRLALGKERAEADQSLRNYGIVASSSEAGMSMLSGGNQQKVVLGRWLCRRPSLFLLDEPTQGVDAGAREQLYRLIHDAVDSGAGALIVASDFAELARMCDRVIVIVRGRVQGELSGTNLTAHRMTEKTFEFDRHVGV